MNQTEISHRIERVILSCENRSQLTYGRIWSRMLINKFYPYRGGIYSPISMSKEGKRLHSFLNFIYKRQRRSFEN